MMQKMPVDVQFICEILSLSYKCDVKLKKMLYSFSFDTAFDRNSNFNKTKNFSSYLLIRCSFIEFDNFDFCNYSC